MNDDTYLLNTAVVLNIMIIIHHFPYRWLAVGLDFGRLYYILGLYFGSRWTACKEAAGRFIWLLAQLFITSYYFNNS